MKLIIILAAVALSNAAKLDRNYLPPSHAQTSGGSGSFLEAPLSGPTTNQRLNGFAQTPNGIAPSANDYAPNGNAYGQRGNNFIQNDNNYAPNNNGFGRNYDNANFNNYNARPERPQAALERNAAILRQDNQNDGESYAYAYETDNGIYAEENGVATNGVEAQGGYSYTGDDGQIYSIRYTAGQNGFIPEGDHLPTPPPVPEEILKALEQNARDEAAGIYDDGSYNDGKYSNDNGYDSNANNFVNDNRYTAPTFGGNRNNDDDSVVISSARMPEESQNRFNSITAGQERFPGANKAYLPPTQSQRGFGRTSPNSRGFGSRKQPSYNARTGYQY